MNKTVGIQTNIWYIKAVLLWVEPRHFSPIFASHGSICPGPPLIQLGLTIEVPHLYGIRIGFEGPNLYGSDLHVMIHKYKVLSGIFKSSNSYMKIKLLNSLYLALPDPDLRIPTQSATLLAYFSN